MLSRTSLLIVLLLFVFQPTLFAQEDRNPVSLYNQGKLALDRSDYRSAIHYFRLAVERNPKFTKALAGEAKAYYAIHDYENAALSYRKVLDFEKDNLSAMTGLGLTLLAQGNRTESIGFFKRVGTIDPGNVENNFALGLYYASSPRPDIAVGYFQKVIRRDPLHIDSLLALSDLKVREGDFDEAQKYINQARRIRSDYPGIHQALGNYYLQQALRSRSNADREDLMDDAYRSFLTAADIERNPDLQRKLVTLDMYRNKFARALDEAKELLRNSPSDSSLYYLVGYLYRLNGSDRASLDKALQSMKRSIDLNPSESVGRFGMEELLIENSLQVPDASLLRKELSNFHKQMIEYYHKQNRTDWMFFHLRRALEIYPDDERLLREQLEIYRRQGNYPAFLSHLIRLRDRYPDDVKIHLRLEQALRDKDHAVAFRENLLSPEFYRERATFKRTPTKVFIFDMDTGSALPAVADASVQISRALNFHLREPGRVVPVDSGIRDSVMHTIRTVYGSGTFRTGVSYSPEYIGILDESDTGLGRAPFIVGGRYKLNTPYLEVEFDIMDRTTGKRLHRFNISSQGKDAIHDVTFRAARKIRELLPYSGLVVKNGNSGIYINLGMVDGIKKGESFTLHRAGRLTGTVSVEELGLYASRVKLTQGNPLDVTIDDRAVPAPTPATPTPAKAQ